MASEFADRYGPWALVAGASSVQEVVDDAFANLTKGPTRLANKPMRWGLRVFFPFSRNTIVRFMSRASVRTMGEDPPTRGFEGA